jgi:hypothetical protein
MPEEPYEGNLHVRICGGCGWVTTASTRKQMRESVVANKKCIG